MISLYDSLSCSLAVSYMENRPLLQKMADLLGKSLALPVIPKSEAGDVDCILFYTENGLKLQYRSNINGTLFIDFLSQHLTYRRQHGGGIKQPLARAVGIKANIRPSIFDATAGLGQDAFILASLGCPVCMVERSSLLTALLKDALQRAKPKNLELISGDAFEVIPGLKNRPDTIYLDPMYPHKNKSALNKQEMRIIRELVGDDTDVDDLLKIAIKYARKRVVVKRPKGAPALNDQKPSHVILLKNSRFDVYMCQQML